MTITQRGNGYQATVTHQGRRWRRQFDSHHDAQIWEAQSKADILAGGLPVVGDASRLASHLPKTLSELVDYTYKNHWAPQKNGEGSRAAAMAAADVMRPMLPISKVDTFAIDHAILKLQELGNSNGTINRKMACLSKCLTIAVDLGIIKAKPKIRKLPEKQGRIRWYSD
ncbi:MAG: hypothetical protein QGF32_06655, partial [Candidatus Thalassarchaeaceae archaeon]|nr:hypothetical protein [Candidatus Thalassarchaeaceae archaeon]